MGWGIKLTDEQWNELDRLRFSAKSADVFRNCLIILMSHSSDTIASIAERLGCTADTVVRVRRLYRKGGAEACARSSRPAGRGRPPPSSSPRCGRPRWSTRPLWDMASQRGRSPD